MNISASFVGVVLKESSGKPSNSMQFHARDGMRKEIQNNSGGHTKFFTQQERFVNSSRLSRSATRISSSTPPCFKKTANLFAAENPDKLQTPVPMCSQCVRAKSWAADPLPTTAT